MKQVTIISGRAVAHPYMGAGRGGKAHLQWCSFSCEWTRSICHVEGVLNDDSDIVHGDIIGSGWFWYGAYALGAQWIQLAGNPDWRQG
jgi:hypothetical protein